LKIHGKYIVTFSKSVTKDFRGIPSNGIKPILGKIDAVNVDPRGVGCIKRSAQERDRVTQDVCRIVSEIRDEEFIIQVVKVAHRCSFYRRD
jgi:mRNA interferase RelE/StbE